MSITEFFSRFLFHMDVPRGGGGGGREKAGWNRYDGSGKGRALRCKFNMNGSWC